MKFIKYLLVFLLIGFVQSCSPKVTPKNDDIFKTREIKENLTSINIIDRNNVTETISSKERLKLYQNTNFISSQPYLKVLRVYGKDPNGIIRSVITSYYENGELKQYLEVESGRANGLYFEKHQNGKKKLVANVIAGLPDISEKAQDSWSFDGVAMAWDEEENLLTKIPYEKGLLQGTAYYYYPSGKIERTVSYSKGLMDGEQQMFTSSGELFSIANFSEGIQDGESISYWVLDQIAWKEVYKKGLLFEGEYYDDKGVKLSQISAGQGKRILFGDKGPLEIQEYNNGVLEGEVIVLTGNHYTVHSTYQIKDNLKHGEEVHYYLLEQTKDKSRKPAPKILFKWYEGKIHGICKTWYENGIQESQREMSMNKKHGLLSAWYIDGSLMLIEEYDRDRLVRGEYLKKGESRPTSYVAHGKGEASLFDKDGFFIRTVKYHEGKPLPEEGV